eukprot:403330798
MGKVNVLIGSKTPNNEQKFQSEQGQSFKPTNITEFRDNLNERLRLGSQIKNFHHKQKIYMGNPKTLQNETSGILSQPVDSNQLDRQQDYESKRAVAKDLKHRLRSSNFKLGSAPDNYQKVDHEQYNKELQQIYAQSLQTSPTKNKNHSNIQLSPKHKQKFETINNDNLDINRMQRTSYEQLERPKQLNDLKESSIKFSYPEKQYRENGGSKSTKNSKRNPFGSRAFSSNDQNNNFGASNGFNSKKMSSTSLSFQQDNQEVEASIKNNLKLNKILKEQFENSPRSHLTSGIGQVNQVDYQTMNAAQKPQFENFDQAQRQEAKDLRMKMRSTTYSIGRQMDPQTPQNAIKSPLSPHGLSAKKQPFDQQFRNPNLIQNLHLGQKQNSATVNDRFSTMSGSYYQTFYNSKGQGNTVQSPIDKFQKTAQELKAELLGHGFELGFDPQGGANQVNNNQKQFNEQMNLSLATKQPNSEHFKKNAERQNFQISQNIGKSVEANIWNKQEGKNYGTGRYVSNYVDYDFLKKSNIPFGMNTPKPVAEQHALDLQSRQQSNSPTSATNKAASIFSKTGSNFNSSAQQSQGFNSPLSAKKQQQIGNYYNKIKEHLKVTNVPFSPDQRKGQKTGKDEAFSSSFYKSQFEWKQPVYDTSQ